MTQLVARVDDSLVAEVDRLVATGFVTSRSEAMRLGLEGLVEEHRRREIGANIVDAYRRQPQTEGELAGIDAATRALVEEEPW
jgi:Arc/MetJ-type ribon-helix-helix transcriptional regulator